MKRWHSRRRHSLTGKLITLFLLMAVLFVILVGGSMSALFRQHFKSDIQPHFFQYLEYIRHDIGTPVDTSRAKALAKKLNVDIYIAAPDGNWASNGQAFSARDLEIEEHVSRDGIEYGIAELNDDEMFMVRYHDTTFLYDIPNLRLEHNQTHALPIVILLLVLLLLYHLTQRMIHPVSTLKEGIKRIGQGELDHRINLKRHDELGDLADSINEMADDIQKMLDAKRQLLLAISHELRSPITRAKLALALPADEQNRLEMEKDLNEMEKLIEELLETERLSGRHVSLNLQPCEINQLVKGVIDDYFASAALQFTALNEALSLSLDSGRMRLLLKNVIENALRYSRSDTPPSLQIQQLGNELIIEVRDTGEGIEEEHLAQLTEPFYRVDPSRQRETGGYGLGLYLCRVITEAHGGELNIASQPGQGTTVMVRLPLQPKV